MTRNAFASSLYGASLGIWAALWGAPPIAVAAESIEITVRPSGIEDEGARNRERLERLSRRFDQAERAFRHICVVCGLAVGEAIPPFNPLQTLAAKTSEPKPVVIVPETSPPEGEEGNVPRSR